MKCVLLAVTSCLIATIANVEASEPARELEVSKNDWPWWRGPNRNGIADPDQDPPLTWSASKNVIWAAQIPGRGHGSPIVFGEMVYLPTADHDKQTQSVMCFVRENGILEWSAKVHEGGFAKKGNKKASLASSSVACDGERVFANFLHDGAVYTTGLDFDGVRLWQKKIGDYVVHQGYGSSPAIYGSLVIVSADNKGGGTIAALDRKSGDIVWSKERPKKPNYASPIIFRLKGKDQLLFTGCDFVTSLNPTTGDKHWEIKGSTTECVTSIVTDGERVFTSGGYPRNHMSAIAADGSGKVVWANNSRVYVPSMLVRDGYIYAVQDAGVATCWKSDTGESVWKGRLKGQFTSSPVMVGERIYVTSEKGETFVFKASPEKFELLATNKLGDEVLATPAICGGRIYMRVATQRGGKRQEMLYCLGKR